MRGSSLGERRSDVYPRSRLRLKHLLALIGVACLALLPGLGSAGRLTYHEAFVAQGSREILDSGQWLFPTIGGLPWLEKPPLPWWLTALLGRCWGGIDETIARLPSALAAIGLVLGVAVIAARHYGPAIGVVAGAIQATTAWTVLRGRPAEADVLLAFMITWAIVAFDEIVAAAKPDRDGPGCTGARWRPARWIFFGLLGATSLVKGIGFGAAIILSVVAGMLLWSRDRVTLRRLCFPAGWLLAAVAALTWPFLMIAAYGGRAMQLWLMHVTDRLSEPKGNGPFASEPWWEYVPTLLAQALPWAPLAIVGSYQSLRRAFQGFAPNRRAGQRKRIPALPAVVVSGDRLLWVWAVAPMGLLSLATVKNAHYAIPAQVPWSIWAALAVAGIAHRLRRRGFDRTGLRRAGLIGFAALALVYGLFLWLVAPRFDRRGIEWAFYESAGRSVPRTMPLALLYDDWDRLPYENPFGPFPHDLAVRLFYLGRPACWHNDYGSMFSHIGFRLSCFQRPCPSDEQSGSGVPSDSAFGVIRPQP